MKAMPLAGQAISLRLSFPLQLALAAALGGANVLCFAPFYWWPLQLPLLAGLFLLVRQAATVRGSALLGLAFGTGWLAACTWWLFVSMHYYGHMPAWLAAIAVLLLSAGLSLLTAAAMAGAKSLVQRLVLSDYLSLLLVLPAAWTLAEWTRGWIFTGFPWTVGGYAHSASPLAGFAPIVGVYGLGWLGALLAGALALAPWKKAPLLLFPLLLGAGWGLQAVTWTTPHGEPISVRLLQGNVPQEMKFARERIAKTLADYDAMIRAEQADLIVTPETALPVLSNNLPQEYVDRLARFADTTGSHIVLGLPVSDSPERYANSVIGIAPNQESSYRYDKHHLVPFGEFIPLGFRWFVNMMHIPLGDFARGDLLQRPFAVKGQWVMPNICYEDLFGEEIAAQLAAGRAGAIPEASILLNVSNIAWFGDTIALPQHLQISQMRALEMQRPMLRATNTGATAVVDHRGQVTAQLPPFETGVLTASVQGYTGATPYILVGNRLAIGLVLLALVAAGLIGRKTRRA